MSAPDLIKRAARGLKSAKLRTLLTALAISVGGFTLALTLGASNGVRNYTEDLVANNFDPAELIVGRDAEVNNTAGPSDVPQEYDQSIGDIQLGDGGSLQIKQVTRADIEELEANPKIEEVRENFTIVMQYITAANDKKYTGSLQAYNPGQKPQVDAGVIPDEGDIAAGSILLPDVYLNLLNFDDAESAIGQKVNINLSKELSVPSLAELLSEQDLSSIDITQFDQNVLESREKSFEFEIAAVISKPATSLAFGVLPLQISSEDARVMYDYTAEGTANYDKYIYVSVRAENGENKLAREELRVELEADGYFIQTSDDIQQTLNQFVNILSGMVFALGAITLVASVFGIVNTQYISVLERTREIGLMKALGMSRRNISQLFIYEAAWIGFIGGALGIIGAIIVGTLLNPAINNWLDIEDNLIIFNPLQLLVLLISLMLVGVFAGLLPARKAAKLDPVEALRTE